jgi:hypothetical protein
VRDRAAANTNCPYGYELRRYKTRPLLAPALGGYVAIGIIPRCRPKARHHMRIATRHGSAEGVLSS